MNVKAVRNNLKIQSFKSDNKQNSKKNGCEKEVVSLPKHSSSLSSSALRSMLLAPLLIAMTEIAPLQAEEIETKLQDKNESVMPKKNKTNKLVFDCPYKRIMIPYKNNRPHHFFYMPRNAKLENIHPAGEKERVTQQNMYVNGLLDKTVLYPYNVVGIDNDNYSIAGKISSFSQTSIKFIALYIKYHRDNNGQLSSETIKYANDPTTKEVLYTTKYKLSSDGKITQSTDYDKKNEKICDNTYDENERLITSTSCKPLTLFEEPPKFLKSEKKVFHPTEHKPLMCKEYNVQYAYFAGSKNIKSAISTYKMADGNTYTKKVEYHEQNQVPKSEKFYKNDALMMEHSMPAISYKGQPYIFYNHQEKAADGSIVTYPKMIMRIYTNGQQNSTNYSDGREFSERQVKEYYNKITDKTPAKVKLELKSLGVFPHTYNETPLLTFSHVGALEYIYDENGQCIEQSFLGVKKPIDKKQLNEDEFYKLRNIRNLEQKNIYENFASEFPHTTDAEVYVSDCDDLRY